MTNPVDISRERIEQLLKLDCADYIHVALLEAKEAAESREAALQRTTDWTEDRAKEYRARAMNAESQLEIVLNVARQAMDVIESVQNYKQPHDTWEENALTMCEHEVFDFDVDTARASLNTKVECTPTPLPPAEAVEQLANYQQADADGTMVLVSRQAIDEILHHLLR